MPPLVKISLALFIAAEAFVLVSIGPVSWPLLGGLFFLPAAAVLFLSATMDVRHRGGLSRAGWRHS
jgi:hypothetical protein